MKKSYSQRLKEQRQSELNNQISIFDIVAEENKKDEEI